MNEDVYRWVAPDGRRGRWRRSLAGALISAVSTSSSGNGVSVRVDGRVAVALWPSLHSEGWRIEKRDAS